LVGVLTTFRVPDKGNKGVWSLVCANAFPVLFFLPILGGKDFLENVFFLRIREFSNTLFGYYPLPNPLVTL